MRITIGIDSATNDEARAFIASYAVTRDDPTKDSPDCIASIGGPESWNVRTPPMAADRGRRMLAELNNGGRF